MPDAAMNVAIQNHSESRVPNGSELTNPGRPAVVSDIELLVIARRLNERLGRPPRVDELTTESGGCQRKRAVSAIRELKLDLAQRAAHSQLLFPPGIEQSIRVLASQWLHQASEQLSGVHAEHAEKTDERLANQQALIEEQQESIALLRQTVHDRERMAAELTRRTRELESEIAHAREQTLRRQTLADERLRLFERFEHNRPEQAMTA